MSPAGRTARVRGGDPDDATSLELRAVRIRELELKRARGEISCAECRRLKLKCDKKVPCSSCKRRGCHQICPTGTNSHSNAPSGVLSIPGSARCEPTAGPSLAHLFTSTPSPLIVADLGSSAAARAKLTAMSARIRALEDALQIEYSSRPEADVPRKLVAGANARLNDNAAARITRRSLPPAHPLLAPELLDIKKDIDLFVPNDGKAENNTEGGEDDVDKDEATNVMTAFGTLSISDGRNMRFLGASATEQTLLLEVFEKQHNPSVTATLSGGDSPGSLPPDIEQASLLWPFAPAHLTVPALIVQLVAQLPPIERASALVEAYFTNLAWFLGPIDRSQAAAELIPLFYPRSTRGRESRDEGFASVTAVAVEQPHELALLYAVFACGAVADLTQTPNNSEAAKYNTLSRAALGLQSVFEAGSLSACQAVFLNGSFEVYSGRRANQESSWKLFSLATCLASSIGIHRDPERWNLDSKTVQRRRRVFWEIYIIDQWKSLGTGRPPQFRPDVIDVEFPEDWEKIVEDDGTEVHSVWHWRYKFARDVLPHVTEKLCSAHPIKYSEILELDRRVRDFDTHPYLLRPPPKDKLGMDPEFFNLHPLLTAWHRETALLYIHRNFFARAMIDFPDDPLRSTFAPSVLSAYRSATCLLRIIRETYTKITLVLFRMWPTWAICLSSAVILATVSSSGPAVNFATTAFRELELSMTMFEEASSHPIVKHGLPLLRRLRDKARAALFGEDSGPAQQPSPETDGGNNDMSKQPPTDNLAPDELLILRGVTRLVEQRSPAPASPSTQAELREAYSALARDYLATTVRLKEAPSAQLSGSVSPATSAESPRTGSSVDVSQEMRNAISSSLFQEMMMTSFAQPTEPKTDSPLHTTSTSQTGTVGTSFGENTQPGGAPWSGGRFTNAETARAWLAAVEQDRAAALVAQFLQHQQDNQELHHATSQYVHPLQDQSSRSLGSDSFFWPPTASGLAATQDTPENQSVNASPSHDTAASFTSSADFSNGIYPPLFEFSTADVDAIMSFPVTLTPVIENKQMTSEAGMAANTISSAEWASFMAQAGLSDADTAMNWDATPSLT